MKLPGKSEWIVILKKSLLCYIGMVITAFGVVFYLRAGLGVDPLSVWANGLSKVFGTTFGTAVFYNGLVILTLAILFARKNIWIGTVFNVLLGGPTINMVESALMSVLPQGGDYSLPIRILLLAGGIIVLCSGLSFVVSARFGFNANDALLFKIADKTRIQYRWIKVTTDWMFVVGGFFLGGSVGVGTVLGAFLFGPLITEIVKIYNKTFLKALGLWDERNEFRRPPQKEAADTKS